MKINIEFIPHRDQRYDTVGDWWLDDDDVLQIRASRMDEPYSALVALHEIVEALVEGIRITGDLRVTRRMVEATDQWDKHFGEFTQREPGYAPACPVYRGHMIASAVEHMVAMLVEIDYNDYEAKIADLTP